MLRVHDGGVLRRETEKAGVEKVDVRQNRLRFDITRILDQFRRFSRRQQLGVGEELHRLHSIP